MIQLDEHLEKMTQLPQYYSLLQQDTVMLYLLCFIQQVWNMLGKAEDTHTPLLAKTLMLKAEKGKMLICLLVAPVFFLSLYLGDYPSVLDWDVQSSNNDAMSSFTLKTMHFMFGLSEVLEAREVGRKKSKAGRAALK
jgi:hypothetical protein